MATLKARMESAQHILHHILKYDHKAKQTGMQISNNKIRLDVRCKTNLLEIDKDEFENRVNNVIYRNLDVDISIFPKKKVPKNIDISMIPENVKDIRVVSIGDFDTQPCGNSHVKNTGEIGTYKIIQIKKKGKDTYRFEGEVLGKDEKLKQKQKFELQLAKGVRDFPPVEKIIRDKVINILKDTFEIYGYNPFQTPIIERLDVLMAKFAAGEDSDAFAEIFKLSDQGKRDLGLRFELTLSLCRHIAMNPNLKLPFKRYEIGRVYRDGPIKLGRYREFHQCDVDIVGTKSMLADAEVLGIVEKAFEKLGFDIIIEVSNRKLLNGILEHVGIKESNRLSSMISIDKLKKIGIKGVNKELKEKGISDSEIERLNKILKIKGSNSKIIKQLKKIINNETGAEGLDELEELFSFTDAMGLKSIEFNPTLARGLGYYTGPIYEAFLKDSKITGSVVGGGRYDEYIGNFLGKKQQIPATGLSFGLEPITEAIKLKDELKQKSVAKVFVLPIGTYTESLKITQELRNNNIKTDIDVSKKGISKNLNYANAQGIPYVLFIGEDELKAGKLKLKDMDSGKEDSLTIKEIIKKLS